MSKRMKRRTYGYLLFFCLVLALYSLATLKPLHAADFDIPEEDMKIINEVMVHMERLANPNKKEEEFAKLSKQYEESKKQYTDSPEGLKMVEDAYNNTIRIMLRTGEMHSCMSKAGYRDWLYKQAEFSIKQRNTAAAKCKAGNAASARNDLKEALKVLRESDFGKMREVCMEKSKFGEAAMHDPYASILIDALAQNEENFCRSIGD